MFIYALVDPRDGVVRYIGAAQNPYQRLGGHLTERSGAVATWLAELTAEHGLPDVHVLEECSEEDWRERERFHIRDAFERDVPLLNIVYRIGHTTQLNVRLPDELLARLQAEANATGSTQSEIVRLALEQRLR